MSNLSNKLNTIVNILGSEVLVKAGHRGFVFEPNYEMKDIDELEMKVIALENRKN